MKRLKLEEFYQKLISQVPGGLFQIERKSGGEFAIPFRQPRFSKDRRPDDQDVPHTTGAFLRDDRGRRDRTGFLVRSLKPIPAAAGPLGLRAFPEAVDAKVCARPKWLRHHGTAEQVDRIIHHLGGGPPMAIWTDLFAPARTHPSSEGSKNLPSRIR